MELWANWVVLESSARLSLGCWTGSPGLVWQTNYSRTTDLFIFILIRMASSRQLWIYLTDSLTWPHKSTSELRAGVKQVMLVHLLYFYLFIHICQDCDSPNVWLAQQSLFYKLSLWSMPIGNCDPTRAFTYFKFKNYYFNPFLTKMPWVSGSWIFCQAKFARRFKNHWLLSCWYSFSSGWHAED